MVTGLMVCTIRCVVRQLMFLPGVVGIGDVNAKKRTYGSTADVNKESNTNCLLDKRCESHFDEVSWRLRYKVTWGERGLTRRMLCVASTHRQLASQAWG